MTPLARLSNALDTGSRVPHLALKLTLSNALDKAVGRRVLRLDRGVSNALDTREAGPRAPSGPPPWRRQLTTPEGPVLPALRRFGVPENTQEVRMRRT
jgi:hypothetical protein